MGAGLKARSAFAKGVLRTVRGSLRRFLAIVTITALGVTMLVGLRAACVDLRNSADSFFDEQGLFDVRVQSTLGLTDEDVAALAKLDGVEAVEGGWVETAYTTVGSASEKVDVKALSDSGLNAPVVLEGHLPERDDQIAVTKRFLEDSGLYVGDTVTFRGQDDGEEDSTEVFERKEYTIIAVVLDPMEINAGEGTMSFRSSGGSQYSFFVLDDSVIDQSVYTVAYLTVEGADAPLCYSPEYEDVVDEVFQSVEDARSERERARGEGLRADATAEVDEAEAEALEELSDAEAELDDAQAQIDDGRAELDDAERELTDQEADAHRQLDDAQAQIDDGYAQLEAAEAQLEEAQAGYDQLVSAQSQIADAEAQLASGRAQIESSVSMLSSLAGPAWPEDAWSRLVNASSASEADAAAAEVSAQIDPFVDRGVAVLDAVAAYLSSPEFEELMGQLEEGYDRLPEEARQRIEEIISGGDPVIADAIRRMLDLPPDQIADQISSLSAQLPQLKELAPGMAEVVKGELEIASRSAQVEGGLAQIASGLGCSVEGIPAALEAARGEISSGRAELDAGATQLSSERASALAQIADGWSQIESGRAELDEGQAELDEGRATFEQERDDALEQIADARDQIDDIPDATWYVQDRSSLSSYASVDSDASSIEALGAVLPVVFFVVAVLVSLTTMTRMVEEERGLIGIYKALGYGRGRILSKYALYALSACLVGWIIGSVLGFVVLPAIIFRIFATMYALPGFSFGFDAVYALVSLVLFIAGIVGATVVTCRHEMRETPASLIRPKAPKAGSRILLERIRPLWGRMSFLHKVTARNLFRYKQRFFMTTLGIAGCVALLVTGFGIRDTVISLSPRQYGGAGVIRYDLMAVASADDLDAVADELLADDEVTDLVRIYIDNLSVSYGDDKETVQLMVVPEGESIDDYVRLAEESGEKISLEDEGVVITKNAEQVMGFSTGEGLRLQDSTLAEGEAAPGAIALNYLGNTIFMTEDSYEAAFDRDFEANGLLAHLSGSADEQVAFSERLSEDGRFLSVLSTQKLVNDFSSAFTLINTVVYVVIILAAALSFTVVFTLSNTNISERERELATLKVLGFKPPEVHGYINKETLILTAIGVVIGLPLGYALARSLTWILRMPSLYFDVVVDPLTYVISAAMAFAFTVIVNLITNRALNRIDMVGALKSAE